MRAWPLALLIVAAATASVLALGCGRNGKAEITGVVVDGQGAVRGASVRVGGRHDVLTTDRQGKFAKPVNDPGEALSLAAWADGYFIREVGRIKPADGLVRIQLVSLAGQDNERYAWVGAQPKHGHPKSCGKCHSGSGNEPSSTLPYDEWQRDPHSSSARNPLFLTLYQGTDTQGRQSPVTRVIVPKDYRPVRLPPDRSKPYYGPGYRLDWPKAAGNCAACHTPIDAVNHPFGTDPLKAKGVAAEGVSCDFCHKVAGARLEPNTAMPYPKTLGVSSYELHRPPKGHQYFATQLHNPTGGGTTVPLLGRSAFCAPCHHGAFGDTVVYDSYGEWLRSAHGQPGGKSCQDCHMKPRGGRRWARQEVGGILRPPEEVSSHDMRIRPLLTRALSLDARAVHDNGEVGVTVELTNDHAGHHVPTGSPLRHVILVVEVTDDAGRSLEQVAGARLPDWCGHLGSSLGNYAGRTVYAKVLEDIWSGQAPTAAFWRPTRVRSDNRIAAGAKHRSRYRFRASSSKAQSVLVRVLYRRAYSELAVQKSWTIRDVVMAERRFKTAPQ